MRPVNALRLLCALTIALGLAAPFASAMGQPGASAQASAAGCDYVALRK